MILIMLFTKGIPYKNEWIFNIFHVVLLEFTLDIIGLRFFNRNVF